MEQIERAEPARGTAPLPVALMRPPRLVGRDAEWSTLASALASGRGLLICGEAGIGKTRLLGDFAAENGPALHVAGRAGDANDPYSMLARLVRAALARGGTPLPAWAQAELARLLPELGEPAPGRQDALRLRQAVQHALALANANGIRLIVADDLHQADSASLELLPALAETDSSSGTCWMFGARAEAIPHIFSQWRVQDAPLPTLLLRCLDVGGVAALLRSLALPDIDPESLAPPLVRHTGGNPLFVLETLRALAGGKLGADALGGESLRLPAAVGELIARRLQQLSPAAASLANVAALAGEDFSANLAASVLRCHALDLAEPWRELEAADVIRGDTFAHDLVLEATLATIPADGAHTLHRAIAGYLQAHTLAAARVALHWDAAHEWEYAGAAYVKSARRQRDASLRTAEVGSLENAIRCFDAAGNQQSSFDAKVDLSTAHLALMNIAPARAIAGKLLGEARDDGQRIHALHCLADVFNVAYESDAAAECSAEMLALARRLGDRRKEFNAARKLVGAWTQLGRVDEALALRATQMDWARENATDRDVLVYLSDGGYLLEQAGRSIDAAQAYREAITASEAAGDLTTGYFARTNLVTTLSRLGELDAALEESNRAAHLRERLGLEPNDYAADVIQRGSVQRDRGAFAQALVDLEGGLEMFGPMQASYWSVLAENQLALCYVLLGQPGRAQRLLPTLPGNAPPKAVLLRRLARSQLARATGARPDARAFDAIEEREEGVPLWLDALLRIDGATAAGTVDGTDRLSPLVVELRDRQMPGLLLHALARLADCALRAGRHGLALDCALEAFELGTRRAPTGLYHPELWWIVYQVLDFTDHHAAAVTSLRRAVDWIRVQALPNVPSAFEDSFLSRNPTNRDVLTTATRRLGRQHD